MKIVPGEVQFFNQFQFPSAVSLLDLLSATDCVFHGVVMLVPDEELHIVLLRKSLDLAVLVGGNSHPKRATDADVKRPIALTRENVDGWRNDEGKDR